MAGNIYLKYGTDAALTQTALDGLAEDSSDTWVSGWSSPSVTNSDENLDYYIAGEFKVGSSGVTAGSINVYVYAALNDTPTWGTIFSSGTAATDNAVTWVDTEVRDARAMLAASIAVDTTVDQLYSFGPVSIAQLFGGVCPKVWAVYVSHNTTAALASTSDPNQIYYMPVMAQYT